MTIFDEGACLGEVSASCRKEGGEKRECEREDRGRDGERVVRERERELTSLQHLVPQLHTGLRATLQDKVVMS